MKKFFLIAICAVLALAACAPAPTDADERQKQSENLKAKIHSVTLDNGMPCAVYEYVKSGGLSCDWDWKSRQNASTPVQTAPIQME